MIIVRRTKTLFIPILFVVLVLSQSLLQSCRAFRLTSKESFQSRNHQFTGKTGDLSQSSKTGIGANDDKDGFEHEARDEQRLIGWLGERSRQGIEFNQDSELGTWVEPISWAPRAFVLHNIMSEGEIGEILEIARPKMERSTVVDSVTGEIKTDAIRTSRQCFIERGKHDVVTKVEERLSRYTMLPWYNGEDLQILSYGVGEKYSAHHDVGEKTTKSGQQLSAEGGHRVATVLLYLEDTEEGGETAFPDSQWINPNSEYATQKFSKCAENGVAVKPKRGDGLLFFSITPEGEIDQKSMHAGCPVVKGHKWTATKWIHARPFHYKIPGPKAAKAGCENKDERCTCWANADECDRNPAFMRENCKWACRVPGCEHKGA